MSAPDLSELEDVIGSLEGALDCLALVADNLCHTDRHDPTFLIIKKLREDAERIGVWFEAAHRAQHQKPCAVT